MLWINARVPSSKISQKNNAPSYIHRHKNKSSEMMIKNISELTQYTFHLPKNPLKPI